MSPDAKYDMLFVITLRVVTSCPSSHGKVSHQEHPAPRHLGKVWPDPIAVTEVYCRLPIVY